MRSLARIDLAAIRHNARRLTRATEGARLMAIVKADGYGHGAAPVAHAALEGGAAALGVATAQEAADLRSAGIGAPILVMGPLCREELREALAADAEIAVWTPEVIAALDAFGAPDRRPRVHLKLDTGMGRLGARPEAHEALLAALEPADVEVVGLMTHFASADERSGENAGFMLEQLVRFRAAAEPLRDHFPGALLHAANSAAALRSPETVLDMVRCGIALYGCSPFHDDPEAHDLRPAMSWESWLGSIKTVRSRDTVGYGRTHRAARGTRIGLVPIGYADGYARALSSRGRVLVGGRRVPVVGAISMDQLTIDLGPAGPERVGDPVVLIGDQGGEAIRAEELAAWRGTINYEVVCAVGPRVPRSHRP